MKGISEPFSSDSEDVPLHIFASQNQSFDSKDIPLDLIATNNSNSEDSAGWLETGDENFSSDLLKQDLLKCDFCDDISTTRLASLKHNATHIVVPLLKLEVHQCDQCLFHFTSLEDLRTHVTSKNHKTSQISDKPSQLSIAEHKEILKSIIQKQLVVRCQDTLSEVLNQSGYKTNNIVNVETAPTTVSSTTITTNPKNIIHVYDLCCSDSENERGAIDLCNSDTEETKNYDKRTKSSPEKDNLKRGKGNTEKEFGNQRHKHGAPGTENRNPERGNSPESEIITPEKEKTSRERDCSPESEIITPERHNYVRARDLCRPQKESFTTDRVNENINMFLGYTRMENGDSRTESTSERNKERLRRDDSSSEVEIIIPDRDTEHLRRDDSSSKVEIITPERENSSTKRDNKNLTGILVGHRRKLSSPEIDSISPERENGSLSRDQSNLERENIPEKKSGNPKRKVGRPRKEHRTSSTLDSENGNLKREISKEKEFDNSRRRDNPAGGIKLVVSKSRQKHCHQERERSNSESPEREIRNLIREYDSPAKGIGKRKRKPSKTDKKHINISSLQIGISNLERKLDELKGERGHSAIGIGKRKRKHDKTESKHDHLERERSNNSNTLEIEHDNPETEISNKGTSITPERANGNPEKEINNMIIKYSNREKEDSSTLETEKGNPERENGNLVREISKERGIDNSRREHDDPARGTGKFRRKHGSIERERSNSSSTERDKCNPEREIGNRKRKHRHQARGIGNSRRRNSNPARGICNPRKRRKIRGNSERESFSQEERSSDPKRDHDYPKREPNSPARDTGIGDRVSPEREHANTARDYFNAEIKHLNTVEDVNSEREHLNIKREHYNTDLEYTEKDTDTSEREYGSSEMEDQRSSPFGQLKLEMSPNQLTEPSSPLEPLCNRIMFEDDYNDDDDDLFEPEKSYQPNSCIIGTKANSLQTKELPDLYSYTSNKEKIVPDLYSYTSNTDKEKIVPDLYSYTSVRDNSNIDEKKTERETIWMPNSFANGVLENKAETDLNSEKEKDGNTIWIPKSFSNRDPDCNPNYFIIGNHKPLEESGEKVEGSFTESEHFDVLIAPLVCDCRYCGRCFGNRFELIKHETIHMRAKPKNPILCCVCERYLAGNHWALRRHMQKYHPHNDSNRKRQRCKVCQFSYHNYHKHVRYYHRSVCGMCQRSFDPNNLLSHKCIDLNKSSNLGDLDLTTESKIVKMCEMCLAFAKNRINVHYEVIRVHSEIGSRQECERCRNMFFEVNLVLRTVRIRETQHGQTCKKKPLSNQERLKKMQNRLKMANKMNKH